MRPWRRADAAHQNVQQCFNLDLLSWIHVIENSSCNSFLIRNACKRFLTFTVNRNNRNAFILSDWLFISFASYKVNMEYSIWFHFPMCNIVIYMISPLSNYGTFSHFKSFWTHFFALSSNNSAIIKGGIWRKPKPPLHFPLRVTGNRHMSDNMTLFRW